MDHSEKLEKLKSLENEKQFRLFLIDLLKRMGFENVQHTHQYGRPEFGKDILAAYEHPIDGTEWFAFVVKVGRIGGSSNEVETLKSQISQCFEYPYQTVEGKEKRVNKVKVISNENITSGAERQIQGSEKIKREANIEFWNNESVIERIDKYYSEFWSPGSPALIEYCGKMRASIENDFELKDFSISHLETPKIEKAIDIFIEPTIIENVVAKKNSSGDRKTLKRKKIGMQNMVSSEDNFVISGEPGCGKTKLLNRVALHHLDPAVASEKEVLTVRLPLQIIKENDFDLEKAIVKYLTESVTNFSSRLNLDDYKLLLILDSVDYLENEEREQLLSSLQNLKLEYDMRFLVATRASEGFNFSDFELKVRKANILNFDLRQVEAFISKFFTASERGKRFIEVLKGSNILQKLPTTPLTITLMSLLYDKNEYEIPATITDIYSDFTSVLLGKLEIRDRGELIDVNAKRRLISMISLDMMLNTEFELPIEHFQSRINQFAERKGIGKQDKEDVRKMIINTGFLYVDDHDQVGFKHSSFKEFFASIEIYNHRRNDCYDKLLNNFNDVHWQNTAIFFAGHSKDLPDFIDDLIQRAPSSEPRDKAVNVGGLGYLAQALYMTDVEDKKKLVTQALDNLSSLFDFLKQQTAKENSVYKDLPLHVITLMLIYWFNMNFKSVTLIEALEETYEELISQGDYEDPNNFATGFKLFAIATTLAHKYLDRMDKFDDLFDRNCFINNPVLMVAGDIILEYGDMLDRPQKKEYERKIDRKTKQYRKLLVELTEEPAYRFGDDYRKIDT